MVCPSLIRYANSLLIMNVMCTENFSGLVLFQMRTVYVPHKMSVEICESVIIAERQANVVFLRGTDGPD